MATNEWIELPVESGAGGGVTSINGAFGPSITIAAGVGISVSTLVNTITITNTGAMGTVTAVTASAPLNSTGGSTPDISISQSGVATDGYLSSVDWNTFNNKQASGAYITALTGDVTATGPGSVAATIANNAVTNAKLADMPAFTFKGNGTGISADPQDLTLSASSILLGVGLLPTTAVQTTGFTIPSTDTSRVYLLNTSGGSFTINLPAASSVPNGTSYTFKDAGGFAGQFPFTVAPNGADLVEGLNSPRPYNTNYGSVTYTSDGISKWWSTSSRSRLATEIFTTSTTWTAPAGTTRVRVLGRPGAGGGGGGGAGGAGFGGATGGGGGGGRGGGGGGSASLIEAFINVIPGTVYTVTIGAGGAAGAAGVAGAGGNGGNGGVTIFDGFTFGRNAPATGGTGGTGGGAGVIGTIGAGGAAGTSGGAIGTVYSATTDLPTAAVSGGAGGATGAGASAGNSAATVPILFGTSNPGANGGAGGAGSGGTHGGGGGGGAGGSSGFPEAYPVSGQAAPTGGTGGNGGNGGLGNNAGTGGAGSNGTAGTTGTAGMGGGGGGAGGGGGGGLVGGARGQGTAGGAGSAGLIIIERVG